MAEVVGVVAAALQFAEIAVKTIKLAREIYQGAKAGPVRHQITQLETFVEVAQKIVDSWTQDDPLTEKILNQCTSTVSDLTGRLERVDVAGSAGLGEKTKKALRARWEKDDIEELFKQLCRDQVALLLHHSFSSDIQLIQRVMDGIRQLLDTRLHYSNPQDHDERRFLNAMFVTDPRDDRTALISRKGLRVEGTCAWVTETDAYRSWLSTAPGATGLLLQGSPGKGKTMMAIYLTEQLELLSDSGNSVIYFFCDNRNPNQNNALAIVRCLLWQLCCLRPAVLCHGMKELQERGSNINNILTFETLWRIFDTMRKDAGAGAISCVIDGLDECDDESVFAILNKLWHLESDPRFKFLILSRPPTPRQQLPAATTNVARLMLDPDEDMNVHRDVVEFVRQRVHEVANASPERQWSEKLRLHVESTLQKKAGGTFLWVGFVTQDLQRRTSTEVRKYLKSLPSDLNEIYDRILKGLPTEHRAGIRSLLHWITLAEHPMRLSELVNLVDIPGCSNRNVHMDPESDSDADSYLETEEDILRDFLAFVGHFVLVVESTVYFVHQSAKDYLLRSNPAGDPDLEFFRIPDREAGHEERARQCLDYLHCQLPLVRTVDGWGSEMYGYTSFHYALHFWRHHVEHGGKAFRNLDTVEKIVRLFRPNDLLWQWLQCLGKNSSVGPDVGCYPPLGHAYRHIPRKFPDLEFTTGLPNDILNVGGLHLPPIPPNGQSPGMGADFGFAIRLGLGSVFDRMLEAVPVDKYTSTVGSGPLVFNWPLHIALVCEEVHFFKQLLNKYGTIAARLEKGLLGYATLHASRWGIANTDQRGNSYFRPLLEVTADPRALYGGDLDEALAIAVEGLSVDVTRSLLEKGANPNATDEEGDTPLHHLAGSYKARFPRDAKSIGRLKVARFLLCQNLTQVDLNSKNKVGNTSLHLAASHQNASFIQTLLDYGAVPDATNFEGRTPLHMAAICPVHPEQFHQLRGSARSTALALTKESSSRTNKLLNVDMQDQYGQTALHLAAFHGNSSMAHILLDLEVDVECRDHQGRTPLHLAAAGGQSTMIRILLSANARVDAVDAKGRTPLALTIEAIDDHTDTMESRVTCMRRLFKCGATCPGQDAEGRTLLHVLARKLQRKARAMQAKNLTLLTEVSDGNIATPSTDRNQVRSQRGKTPNSVQNSHVPCFDSHVSNFPGQAVRAQHSNSPTNLQVRNGAVVVDVPHRHWSHPPQITWTSQMPFESEPEVVRNIYRFGNEIWKFLAEISVNETIKDKHGLTAREYYPDNEFWVFEEEDIWLHTLGNWV